MKKAVGLAAAAAAATLGTGGINAAMASPPSVVGSVMVSLNGTSDPTIVIANTSPSKFSGVDLKAFWGAGKSKSTVIASSLAAAGHTNFTFGTHHVGPFRKWGSMTGTVTAGVKYQVVGSVSAAHSLAASLKFGDPAGTGSTRVDWLGINHATTTRVTASEIYATPEPATVLLLTAGVVGLGVTRRRRVQAGVR